MAAHISNKAVLTDKTQIRNNQAFSASVKKKIFISYFFDNFDKKEVAFIEAFDGDNVHVFSNLCDGVSNMRVRETGKITCVPHSLLNEIQLMQSLETPKSPQLQQWCATVWEEAKRTDQWFEKF